MFSLNIRPILKIPCIFLQLEVLNISENDVGNAGVSSMSDCLHRLKSLVLSNCGLTHLGIEDLAKAASRDQSKVCAVVIEKIFYS